MRVVIVGRSLDRDRLRAELGGSDLEIVGEAATIALARDAGLEADAFLVARSGDPASAPATSDDESASERASTAEPLTPRELDVARLLALGLPNKAIADRLGISDQTVKFHVASIIGKLGAANRTGAVRRAVRHGLIDL